MVRCAKVILAAVFMATAAMAGDEPSVKDDLKDAGRAIEHGAVKGYDKTKDATVEGYEKTKDATLHGVGTAVDKTGEGLDKAGEKLEGAGEKVKEKAE